METQQDRLTGLYNWRYFKVILAQELAKAASENTPTAIVVLDIDCFKNINNLGGHIEGDRVLQEVDNLIQQSTRPADLLCRWGGKDLLNKLSFALYRAKEKGRNQIQIASMLHF